MVGGSWALLHRLWISLPLALGVLAWWLVVSGAGAIGLPQRHQHR